MLRLNNTHRHPDLMSNGSLTKFPSLLMAMMALFLAGNDTVHGQTAEGGRPNLVLILADDCTFRDIGCYGGQAHTPNIDRLATEGMQLTRCYQAAPMCSPTRHNLYTGLYPVKSGAYPNHTFAKKGTRSIAQYLQPLGYRVALSGKTHIGPKDVFPFEYSGGKNPDMSVVEKLFTDSKASGNPFCLIACSNEPHTPWDKGDASRYPPENIQLPPYLADTPVVREGFSRYLAEITYYDGQVGEIMDLLSKHSLDQNTLVMVLSEQGNSLPFAKWTCYGNGLQSAMLVRWPGQVAPGSKSDAMVEYVDVTPTFLEAAGADTPDGLDGKSFLSVLRGETDQHKSHSYGIMTTRGIINGSDGYAIRSVRDDRFRLVWNLQHETTFTNACTQGSEFRSMVEAAEAGDLQAKNVVRRYMHRPEFELFDTRVDPLELNNLAGDPARAETIRELKDKLDAWMQDQGDSGVATEEDAILRQGKYRGLTRAQAYEKYASQQNEKQSKTKRKSKRGGKGNGKRGNKAKAADAL